MPLAFAASAAWALIPSGSPERSCSLSMTRVKPLVSASRFSPNLTPRSDRSLFSLRSLSLSSGERPIPLRMKPRYWSSRSLLSSGVRLNLSRFSYTDFTLSKSFSFRAISSLCFEKRGDISLCSAWMESLVLALLRGPMAR